MAFEGFQTTTNPQPRRATYGAAYLSPTLADPLYDGLTCECIPRCMDSIGRYLRAPEGTERLPNGMYVFHGDSPHPVNDQSLRGTLIAKPFDKCYSTFSCLSSFISSRPQSQLMVF